MMKMADIELVIKIPEKVYNALTHTEFDANLVVGEMRKSIANGTPLVQCKDCKYYDVNLADGTTCFCTRLELFNEYDWFCADGEVKSDG